MSKGYGKDHGKDYGKDYGKACPLYIYRSNNVDYYVD